jgi:hypothetical protein
MPSNKHQSPIESNTAFMVKIEDLVREIVIQNSFPYYRIESRMEHHSLQDGGDLYLPVIRIITYFEDTVSQISNIISEEFDIAIEKSIDKKKIRVDSFSYKHVQYIAGLKENRKELTEYKRSGNKKFEIQVCSMLQDAWTGIEKELGYDNTSFPEETKRDFYRVGALLEMADIEFCKIRSLLDGKGKNEMAATGSPELSVGSETQNTASEAAEEIFAEHLHPVKITEHEDEILMPAPAPAATVIMANTPAAVATAPIAQAAVSQPVPVVAEAAPKTAHVFAAIVSSLVPVRAIPAKPVMGLAPKRISVPVMEQEETPAPAGIKPVSINTVVSEIKKEIVQKAAPVISLVMPLLKSAPVKEQAAPVVQVAAQVAQAAPVMPPSLPAPTVAPVVADIPQTQPLRVSPIAAPPRIEQALTDIGNDNKYNVNANGVMEKAAETAREPERAVPFFEDVVPQTNKSAVLDENAPMNDASLREYVMSSKLLKEVDQKIAERAGAKINPEIDIEGDVERLRFLKVFTLKQLHDRILDNKNDIVAFAEKWIGKDNGGSFDSGISLFYLEYLLVGKKNDPAFAIEYVVKFISDNDYSARYIIPTYNSIRNTEVSNFSHLTLKV